MLTVVKCAALVMAYPVCWIWDQRWSLVGILEDKVSLDAVG